MNTQQLNQNLLQLTNLEEQFKQTFNDKELFRYINLHKKSLAFFLEKNNKERALYETNCLISFLIYHLTD